MLKFYFCVAKTLCIIQRAKFLGSGFCKKVRFEEKNEENCEKLPKKYPYDKLDLISVLHNQNENKKA